MTAATDQKSRSGKPGRLFPWIDAPFPAEKMAGHQMR
jgi:hypothetical protein